MQYHSFTLHSPYMDSKLQSIHGFFLFLFLNKREKIFAPGLGVGWQDQCTNVLYKWRKVLQFALGWQNKEL